MLGSAVVTTRLSSVTMKIATEAIARVMMLRFGTSTSVVSEH